MNPPAQWASVSEARQRILSAIRPVQEQSAQPLGEALNAVLAEDIKAPFDVPGHDNSAMDGFACRLADVCGDGATLRVAGSARAGHPCDHALQDGECVKIMTGAKLPPRCEIVVPQEETEALADDKVRIEKNAARRHGQHMRAAGEDLKKGATALAAGTLCQPAHIGLLASLGLASAPVHRRLRVAFFSTGDEVRRAGEALGSSDVYDSNRHTLRAMIERMGFAALDFGVVADNYAQLADTVDKAAASADAIITSGGASVGEADHIRTVLAERGEVLFWKVAMRPGRPLAYGKIGETDFFGLPGNPVSVMVCFYQFVREALWRRAGRRGDLHLPLLTAATATDLRKVPGRMEFQRGVLQAQADGGYSVRVTGDQGSGILSSMAQANCFIVLPPDCERVQAGDPVSVQLFEGLV